MSQGTNVVLFSQASSKDILSGICLEGALRILVRGRRDGHHQVAYVVFGKIDLVPVKFRSIAQHLRNPFSL